MGLLHSGCSVALHSGSVGSSAALPSGPTGGSVHTGSPGALLLRSPWRELAWLLSRKRLRLDMAELLAHLPEEVRPPRLSLSPRQFTFLLTQTK